MSLDLATLRTQQPHEAINTVARFLGVPPAIVWNQWTVESSRGMARDETGGVKASSVGAKGHFQSMDRERKVWESRDPAVKSLDLNKMQDALYLYGLHMQENLRRTKGDIPAAVRGYFAGWDPDNHGPLSDDYVRKVAYGQGPKSLGLVQATAGLPVPAAPLPQPPAAAPAPAVRQAPIPVTPKPPEPELSAWEQVKAADAILSEDGRAQQYGVLDTLVRMGQPQDDPTWDYRANQTDLEVGLSDDEIEYLRESRNDGKDAVMAKRAEILENRHRDQQLSKLSLPAILAGAVTSQRNNPIALVTTLATLGIGTVARVGLSAQAAGRSATSAQRAAISLSPAQRLAAGGRPLAAGGAALGEAVAVETGLAVLDDTVGRQRMTVGDYSMQIASSLALSGAAELATLPAGLASARSGRAPTSVDEVHSEALHGHQEVVTHLADDIAQDRIPTVTDGDANTVNGATLPEPVGARLGGDAALGRILRDADEADEIALLGKTEEGEPAAAMASVQDTVLPGGRKEHETENPFHFDKLDADRREWLIRNDPQWIGTLKALGEDWTMDQFDTIPAGVHVRPAIQTMPALRPAVKAIQDLAEQFLPDSKIVVGRLDGESSFVGGAAQRAGVQKEIPSGMIMSAGKKHVIGVSVNNPTRALITGIHELSHAIVHENLSKAPPELMARIREQYDAFRKTALSGDARARFERFHVGSEAVADESGALRGKLADTRYTMSFDEWAAEGGVRFIQGKAQRADSDIKFDAGVRALLQSLWNKVKALWERAIEKGYLKQDTPLDEFFQRVLDKTLGVEDTAIPTPEVEYLDASLVASFSVTSAQARKFSDEMNQAALDYLARNPIDTRKLDVLAAMAPERMGALTPGLRLATSKTPLLRMMAGILTETTTGAAGRKATVAVRRDSLAVKLYSDSLQAYSDIADRWAREQGYGIRDREFTGAARREFDRQVYEFERLRGTIGGERQPVANARVMEAAEELEALYQRSADAQRAAGTIGSDKLPASSRGYIPQKLDPAKLAAATAEELTAIRATLSNHWQQTLEWDKAFSDALANLYIDRARGRASGQDVYGAKMVDSTGIGDVRTAVKGALEAGTVTPQQAAAAMQRLEKNDRRGLKTTRERLDVPMSAAIGDKKMLDFFVTDQMSLAHRHVQTVSGEVALTEMGIPGRAGLERIRLAAVNSAPAPSLADMRAFDQVASELFGTAPPTAIYSETAQSIRLMTSVLKLGGVVFNQLAETGNAIHSLGLTGALKQIVSLPGKYMDVRTKARGGILQDNLLESIETWGGEIGMGDYRINFPLRATDDLLREYTEDPGVVSALIKNAAMLQHKVSFMRGVHAAQHRATAEQILHKAAKYINKWDGMAEVPQPLRDMGFDAALLQKFKDQWEKVADYDDGGRLRGFDVQAVGDTAATEAFVQAIHRGTRQIIQGTFIGERNAWVHNDWMGVLTQFRTFSITAMEKQWARTRFSKEGTGYGYAYLGGMIVAQSALAYPIYLARVQSQALLIQDEEAREKFLNERLAWHAVTRGLMNYASASGLLGDMLEYSLMFGGKSAGIEGARGAGQADIVSSAIPAAGAVNQAGKALGAAGEAALDPDKDVKVERVLKQLPFSSLWYVVPFINMAKD
jgi:hypothetical protein